MAATTAEIIIDALHRQGKTRKWLVHAADITQSSFEKAMSGARPFPLPMLARIGLALGVTFDAVTNAGPAAVAPEALGAYSRPGSRWLEGSYIAIRHAARHAGLILAHAIRIGWDESGGCLVHHHSDDPGGAVYQRGEVSIPSRAGHVFLVTNNYGQHELAIFAPPAENGILFGLNAALVPRRGATLPACGPIVLVPHQAKLEGERAFGVIEPDSTLYPRYVRLLADAQAIIATLPEHLGNPLAADPGRA